MALWTVPRGYTAFVDQLDITANTEVVNKYVTVDFLARPFGGVFNIADRYTLARDTITQKFRYPRKFEEKTDLEVRAISSSSAANVAVSAAFDIIYIENRPYPE